MCCFQEFLQDYLPALDKSYTGKKGAVLLHREYRNYVKDQDTLIEQL